MSNIFPPLHKALPLLLDKIVQESAELRGLRPESILTVFHGAHGGIAASVRELSEAADKVTVGGAQRHIEMVLRPPFFQDGDAPRRLTTLVHELLHIDPLSPMSLRDAYRHENRPHAEHEEQAREIAVRLLATLPANILAPLAHHGMVEMKMWVQRPVRSSTRMTYEDRDLMNVVVPMNTPQPARSTWWT